MGYGVARRLAREPAYGRTRKRREGVPQRGPLVITRAYSSTAGAAWRTVKPPCEEISDALRSLSVGGEIVEFARPNPTGMCGFEIKTEVIVELAAPTRQANLSAILKNSNGPAARPMAAVYPIREESSVV